MPGATYNNQQVSTKQTCKHFCRSALARFGKFETRFFGNMQTVFRVILCKLTIEVLGSPVKSNSWFASMAERNKLVFTNDPDRMTWVQLVL